MAKRKIDCNLDDIVAECFKKGKYEKTAKMFGTNRENDPSKVMEEFIEYLKQKEMEKENQVEDDLGFQINFGAFKPTTKVSFSEIFITEFEIQKFCLQLLSIDMGKTEKANRGPKKETEKRKTDIPKVFIQKIKKLGMRVEDAEVLYKSKIDWCAVYSEKKIYCAEPGCDYFTKIDSEELTNHMINVHNYGKFPCEFEHCDYVGFSKVNFYIFSICLSHMQYVIQYGSYSM